MSIKSASREGQPLGAALLPPFRDAEHSGDFFCSQQAVAAIIRTAIRRRHQQACREYALNGRQRGLF